MPLCDADLRRMPAQLDDPWLLLGCERFAPSVAGGARGSPVGSKRFG
jgi:hypothetical protein